MKTTFTRITTGLLLAGLFASQALAQENIVIAHRGASGYLPEHTFYRPCGSASAICQRC